MATIFSEACERDLEFGNREYSLAEAASVTGSLVREESIVEIRTLKGVEFSSLLILLRAVVSLMEFRITLRIFIASGPFFSASLARGFFPFKVKFGYAKIFI